MQETLDRKNQLKEVAQSLFKEKGYVGASMRDMAQTLGIEAPSIYNHVSSKQELLSKICFDILGVLPTYISTYNSRKYAFPELMVSRKNGLKPVLFGGYDTKIDKKMIIWEKVAELEPQVIWLHTKNQTLKKESFDMTDAYTCVLGHMKQEGIWS